LLFAFIAIALAGYGNSKYPNTIYGRIVSLEGKGISNASIKVFCLDFVQNEDFHCAVEKIFMQGRSDHFGWFNLILNKKGVFPEQFLSKVFVEYNGRESYKYLNVNDDNNPPIAGIERLTVNPENSGSLFESEWVAINRTISDPEKYMQKSLTGTKREMVRVEIKTFPKGAFVEINNTFIGTTDLVIYLEEEKVYEMRLYQDNIQKNIMIDTTRMEHREKKTITLTINLKKQ